MNTNATPEDRITAWLLSDAPPQAPDRLLEDTFEQTRRIRRRGSPLEWRIFSMMRSIALVTTAAVVVVALVMVGGGLLDRSPGVGGPPATAPSALPSGPSPSQSQVPASVGPTDTPRRYWPPGMTATGIFPAAAGLAEPRDLHDPSIAPALIDHVRDGDATGWERPPNAPEFFGPEPDRPAARSAALASGPPRRSRPFRARRQKSAVVELPPEAIAEDVVSAHAGLPGVDMSSPKDVTVSGFTGTYLER